MVNILRENKMTKCIWNIYLSGEIHTDWRNGIEKGIDKNQLNVNLMSPVTVHNDSDDCGARILGVEQKPFWNDFKGASINSIRNRNYIEKSDIVIVRFGDKYRQWNAAFDAGLAIALGKSLITLHDPSLNHALKEVDSAANAVCSSVLQVVSVLKYVIMGKLENLDNATVAEQNTNN